MMIILSFSFWQAHPFGTSLILHLYLGKDEHNGQILNLNVLYAQSAILSQIFLHIDTHHVNMQIIDINQMSYLHFKLDIQANPIHCC